MMSFVLQRTDQGGGFVAQDGSGQTYTHSIRLAKKYSTREAADADRCPDNEVVVDVLELLHIL